MAQIGLENKSNNCSICKKDIQPDERIECPFCSSSFHYRHLLLWIKIRNSCPVCKKTSRGFIHSAQEVRINDFHVFKENNLPYYRVKLLFEDNLRKSLKQLKINLIRFNTDLTNSWQETNTIIENAIRILNFSYFRIDSNITHRLSGFTSSSWKYEFQSGKKDEQSLLVIQLFSYLLHNALLTELAWVEKQGFDLFQYITLESNFLAGEPSTLEKVIDQDNILFHPQGYTLQVYYNEKLLRKQRIKSSFDASLESAWDDALTEILTILKRYSDGYYLHRISERLESLLEKLEGSILPYYVLEPEAYLVGCSYDRVLSQDRPMGCGSQDNKNLLPDISCFILSGYSITSREKTDNDFRILQVFYQYFRQYLIENTQWLRDDLSEYVFIKTDWPLDDMAEVAEIIGVHEEYKASKKDFGFKIQKFTDDLAFCVIGEVFHECREWFDETIYNLNPKQYEEYSEEIEQFSNFINSSELSDGLYYDPWNDPNEFIVKWRSTDPLNLVSGFFGRSLFVIEKILDKVFTLRQLDWREFYKIECYNVEVVELKVRDNIGEACINKQSQLKG